MMVQLRVSEGRWARLLVSGEISDARILLLQPFLLIKSVHHDCLDRGDALNVAHSGDRFDLQTPRPWNDDDAKCSETFFCSFNILLRSHTAPSGNKFDNISCGSADRLKYNKKDMNKL